MKVRFYGVRGSVPTPGSATVRYGGNTVCVDVRLADGTPIVLDAGTGIRELGNHLLEEDHDGPITLLLTHLHWDHIMGVPFFGPIYRKKTHIRIHSLATEVQRSVIRQRALFDGVHFPVRATDLPARFEFLDETHVPLRVGSATVRRVLLNHPGGAQGFRIDDGDGKSIAYLTDNELSPPGEVVTSLDELARFAEGVDLLIHDAQYVEADMPAKRGWGHSTLDDVLALAKKASPGRLVLFHHDPERDDRALDALGAYAEHWLRENAGHTTSIVGREGWRTEL
jgi:phosphoribosyl 1,2-cyclic phosphodiesterase